MVRTYTRGTIVPFEEDIVHEFKGHRTISIENRMPLTKEWQNGKLGECLNTRQQWSKYLCGMLNSGVLIVKHMCTFGNNETLI